MPDHKFDLDLLIITPLFFGDASGASVYYRLLTQQLIKKGITVGVISDAMKGEFQGAYMPLFPSRCGLNKSPVRDYTLYAFQNLQYFALPQLIRRCNPRSLLIHSSFYNVPGFFPQVISRVLKVRSNCPNVADVRDHLMPLDKVKHLDRYDRVVACSENVAKFLLQSGMGSKKLISIPVLQNPIHVDEDESVRLVKSLGILSGQYIFYAGLIKEEKAVDLLLEAFTKYVRKTLPDINLVISGLVKTTNAGMLRMLRQDGVVYIGNRTHNEVLQLMSQSSLCVNFSPNEGLPRSSLEALALNRPVLLPPNISEFIKYCPEFVVVERNPRSIAEKIINAIGAQVVASYPIQRHYPEAVLPLYAEVLGLSI